MEVGEIGCWIEFAYIDVYLVDGVGPVNKERNAFFCEKLLESVYWHDYRRH